MFIAICCVLLLFLEVNACTRMLGVCTTALFMRPSVLEPSTAAVCNTLGLRCAAAVFPERHLLHCDIFVAFGVFS